MDSSTIRLVHKAKAGDRDAWSRLIDRFYERWIDRVRGHLGKTLRRKVGDTVDLVDSALGDALRDLPSLESEPLFFTWVMTIIRRKIPAWRRRLRRPEERVPSSLESPADQEGRLGVYLETLDAIIELFPDHPREMTAVVWRYLDVLTFVEIARRLETSESTARNWHRAGAELLRERLSIEQ